VDLPAHTDAQKLNKQRERPEDDAGAVTQAKARFKRRILRAPNQILI